MKRTVLLFFFCVASLILPPGLSSADEGAKTLGRGPRPGLQPLDKNGRMRISKEDRCPVCAMRPGKNPKFTNAIQLKDGRTFYFCGPGCMIRTWMHPEIFLAVGKEALGIPVTRVYGSGEEMDARSVRWVFGSNVLTSMGPGPIPVYGQGELETFMKRHGGRFVYGLEQMDDEKWEKVTGRHPLPGR